MEERGIIYGHKIIISNQGIVYDGGIDPIDLRKFLLYWDFMDFPYYDKFGSSNLNANPDAILLKDQGFLKQTKIVDNSLEPVPSFTKEWLEQYLLLQFKAKDVYELQGTICSVNQRHSFFQAPPSLQEKIEVFELELFNCLPIPTADVHISKILEFKNKRYNELVQLRSKIDNLYIETKNNFGDLRVQNKAIKELKQNLKDIDQLLNESRISKIFSGFKVLIKIPLSLYGGFLTGQAAATSLSLPLFETGVLGAIAAGLTIEPKSILGPLNKNAINDDFAYLYNARKELNIK